MLSDSELVQVQSVADKMSRAVAILVSNSESGTLFEGNLVNIVRQIAGVSLNRIRMDYSDEGSCDGRPCLTLSAGNARNIRYIAAPEGPEFGPFMEAVKRLGRSTEPPESKMFEVLQNLKDPVEILVLIAPVCPHCPKVVRSALELALRQPLISVTVADATEFPDLADKYKVRATPTTIINEGMTVIGHVTEEQLIDRIMDHRKTGSLTAVLESMIKSGRAEDAGLLLCREDRPEAILPIYLSHEFSVRMGALVAMEDALEENPRALDPIIEDLTALLTNDEVGLRGDTAELLGKMGNPQAIEALRAALNDPDPDVREAVEEALERLAP